jgi:hypothetical protein
MKFYTPTKSFTPKLLMTLLLFIPFIIPGKRALNNEITDYSYKGQTFPIHGPNVHHILQERSIVDPGHEYNSPTAAPVPAAKPALSLAFARFVRMVMNGQAGVVRGIYVEGILALQVVQQPDKEWTYVSGELGKATEFQNAANNGIIGLLAHNFLSGRLFYSLKPGAQIEVVYGDGAVRYYQVSGSYRYQKLDPNDLSSKLIDLSTGSVVSSGQVFERFYDGADHIALQTCLEKNGLSTWGLYFVVALPLNVGG